MDKNKIKYILSLVIILFIVMLLVSGGAFAYFQWQTSVEQRTALSVSVTDNIKMTINPAAVSKTGMRPTKNCGGEFAMVGTSTVTIDNQTGTLARPRFKLKIKITDKDGNNITAETSPAGQKYMYYVKYAVTEEDGDCTSSIMEGRFSETTETTVGSGWYDSPSLTLDNENGFPDIYTSVSFSAKANGITTHKYKVVVWIDSTYTTVNTGDTVTNDKLQNATITVSWSENSTVEQVSSVIERPSGTAYAVYSADDTSLRFYRSETPITAGSTYNELTATTVYTGFEEESYDYGDAPWDSYGETITKVVFEDVIVPKRTAYWFHELDNCIIFDVAKLNTSNVTDMEWMFSSGRYSDMTTFSITGLENWDTSNVTNMSSMFYNVGSSATTFSITGLENWDTSNVTNMSYMFRSAGTSATTFELDLSNWDVSNVEDFEDMFYRAGYSATIWSIGDISNWDTSNVTYMYRMFYNAGRSANYTLDLSGWNVNEVVYWYDFAKNVTDKIISPSWIYGDIFYAVYSADDTSLRFYKNSDTITVGDIYNGLTVTKKYELYEHRGAGDTSSSDVPWYDYLEIITNVVVEDEIIPRVIYGLFYGLTQCTNVDVTKLNTSNVTDMSWMFSSAGYSATTFSITGLENWDTSNVTNMSSMFYYTGKIAGTWSIGDISNWDTSSVTNMSQMFYDAGMNATTWSIGDISNWDTSSVTNMSQMFYDAGMNATTFELDLNGWDTSKVTDMSSMFDSAGQSATTFELDLSNWDTSSVINMNLMFSGAGYSATTWSIGDISNWDTSSVINMNLMFSGAGYSATTWSIGDISNWDTSSVTDMGAMFNNAGKGAGTWSIGDLSGWDVSNVTNMTSMFNNAGSSAGTWIIGDISNWDTSSVTDMGAMFNNAGKGAGTWSIGDLSGWDVSNVTDMDSMFAYAGSSAGTWSIGDISNWDTSSVTDMDSMFINAGSSADYTLDLRGWNVCNVTSYFGFNTNVTSKITAPNFGMSCPTT